MSYDDNNMHTAGIKAILYWRAKRITRWLIGSLARRFLSLIHWRANALGHGVFPFGATVVHGPTVTPGAGTTKEGYNMYKINIILK